MRSPVLWPPHVKSWLIGKVSDAGRDWGQEEKGTTEDEMSDGIADSMDVSLSELRELVMNREAWRAGIHEVAKSRTRLSDWSDLIWSEGGVTANEYWVSLGGDENVLKLTVVMIAQFKLSYWIVCLEWMKLPRIWVISQESYYTKQTKTKSNHSTLLLS